MLCELSGEFNVFKEYPIVDVWLLALPLNIQVLVMNGS